MRLKSCGLFLLLGVLAIMPARAATVTAYYQPTPYPLKKYDGSSLPQDLEKIHIWDGWVNSYYPSIQTLQRTDILRVGGWGDTYRTYTRFDVVGLPKSVLQAAIWFWPIGSDAPTTVDFYKVTTSWTTALKWSAQPAATFLWNRAAPVPNQWYGTDITQQYNAWRSSSTNASNWGLRLDPKSTNNNFDTFYSSRYSGDGARPVLGLTFSQPLGMPNFKMPLPGGYRWLVTTEVGGYDCLARDAKYWPDTTHQGNNYFSIDFSPRNTGVNGGASYPGSDIPVLAAEGGTVIDFGGGNTDSRGYYITIDHGSGYQTRYLHLKQQAARKNGTPFVKNSSIVGRGDQLGIMGNTGTQTTAKHLHINFWYNKYGRSTDNNLTYVVMDNWLLKSFQTECLVNSNGLPTDYKRYYLSSNTPTGL